MVLVVASAAICTGSTFNQSGNGEASEFTNLMFTGPSKSVRAIVNCRVVLASCFKAILVDGTASVSLTAFVVEGVDPPPHDTRTVVRVRKLALKYFFTPPSIRMAGRFAGSQDQSSSFSSLGLTLSQLIHPTVYDNFSPGYLEPGLHVRCVHATLCKLGAVAQLGARLNGIQKVKGSNPFSSTKRKM
jgi:hypothetical protein